MMLKDLRNFLLMLPEIAVAVGLSYVSLRWCLLYSVVLILWTIYPMAANLDRSVRIRWYVTYDVLSAVASHVGVTQDDLHRRHKANETQLGPDKLNDFMNNYNAVLRPE